MTSKNVPEDVVLDILSKLPVKTLLRFRCVCKEWHLLLDSPYFESTHLECSRKKNTTCIFVKRLNLKKKISSFSLVSEETLDIVSWDVNIPLRLTNNHTFLGPINGIVCIFNAEIFFFCSPSTREFKALPPCNLSFREFLTLGNGFGFDEKSNDYKLIRIIKEFKGENYQDIRTQIMIYSLANDCWRNLDHLTLPDALYTHSAAGYFNGACHWFVRCYNHESVWSKAIIMSFRMDTEVFEEIPIPSHVCSHILISTIFVSNTKPNNLSAILQNYTDRTYEVWVMREYGVKESWSKQYALGRIGMIVVDKSLRPKSIGNVNELLLCGRDGEPVLYNIDTKETRVLKFCKEDSIRCTFYMESLVSIKRISGAA